MNRQPDRPPQPTTFEGEATSATVHSFLTLMQTTEKNYEWRPDVLQGVIGGCQRGAGGPFAHVSMHELHGEASIAQHSEGEALTWRSALRASAWLITCAAPFSYILLSGQLLIQVVQLDGNCSSPTRYLGLLHEDG